MLGTLKKPWSDLEKNIFLDKFLQFPKNFGKIATFLRLKDSKDCVRFYYESKKNVDFKALLREHQQRRRGLKLSWTETIYAMNSFRCSTFCDDDDDDEQDLSLFQLPNEQSFTLFKYRHLQRQRVNKDYASRSRTHRSQGAWIVGDEKNGLIVSCKNLKRSSVPEANGEKLDSDDRNIDTVKRRAIAKCDESLDIDNTTFNGAVAMQRFPQRSLILKCDVAVEKRTLQKWTENEKELFMHHFQHHGKDWRILTRFIPTKTEAQIKNYYQNYKNRLGLKNILINRISTDCDVNKNGGDFMDDDSITRIKNDNEKKEGKIIEARQVKLLQNWDSQVSSSLSSRAGVEATERDSIEISSPSFMTVSTVFGSSSSALELKKSANLANRNRIDSNAVNCMRYPASLETTIHSQHAEDAGGEEFTLDRNKSIDTEDSAFVGNEVVCTSKKSHDS